MGVTIVGAGNVGHHLAISLSEKGCAIDGILSRRIENARELAMRTGTRLYSSYQEIPEHSLVLICTPDDSIMSVVQSLSDTQKIAYTSGSFNLNRLERKGATGVFYPLQTFTKHRDLDLSTVPFLLESENNDLYLELQTLANLISCRVIQANSAMRAQLHLAAVWLNNFTNHMVYESEQYARSQNLDFSLLHPLLEETFSKLKDLGPAIAQTGPARRDDKETIRGHLLALDELEIRELYKTITNSILTTYGHEKL